jgi:predicted DNA-binding transcriptional regulator YafY
MLASRLLQTLMLLQSRKRISASELASTLEVSVRTIHRDIDQLTAAGIPVYAERGRNGGFSLLDGYQTRLTGMTVSEVEALPFIGLPEAAEDLGVAATRLSAGLKLLAALPSGLQPNASTIAERFHLDPKAWFSGTDTVESLRVVAHAVWSGHWLKLSYRRAGTASVQPYRLGPLGLVLKSGIWYLVAQNGSSIRTYRIANIRHAEMTDEMFDRPEKFDLAQHWRAASHSYEMGVYREMATIRLSQAGLELIELLGPYVAEAVAEGASAPYSDGWVTCIIPIESIESGIRELLRLGEEVEVIGPAILRRRMRQTLMSISRRYGGPPTDS